jgi:hypothetical protein
MNAPLCPFPKVEPDRQFITGSSLVSGVVPADTDIVCLFRKEADMLLFLKKKGRSSPTNGYANPGKFVCARKGKTNYICTCDAEFFYRFKAYSGALSLLQEKDKDRRVVLAKACLYWEPIDPVPF